MKNPNPGVSDAACATGNAVFARPSCFFNGLPGVILRKLLGVGTPRSLQGRAAAACATLLVIANGLWRGFVIHTAQLHDRNRIPKLDLPDPRQRVAA